MTPVSIAGIEFDAMIDRTEDHNATVPKYPIDAGYSVTDHVALEPLTLKMTLYVTATPVTWLARHGYGRSRPETVARQILGVYESRALVSVSTPNKSYDSMVIRSLTIKESATLGYAYEIPVELSHVTVTSAKRVAIPEGYVRAGETMGNAGAASTTKLPDTSATSASGRQDGSASGSTESTAQKNNTILYDLANGIGNKTGWFSLGG